MFVIVIKAMVLLNYGQYFVHEEVYFILLGLNTSH